MRMRCRNVVFVTVLSMWWCVCLAQNSPEDFVKAHNKAREEVGVGPVEWDENVANYAKTYMKKMLTDCNMVHSGGTYGENLAGASSELTANDAVNLWLAEKSNYDYNSNSCVNGECMHYTQLVWGETFNIGCAIDKCHNGFTFAICNYDPPGNFVGQKPY
ncbi:hypothetical protein VNO77_05142 [Canavalia gladiata]|uniref:SCP domain-containing protein n=1 Tax=Canavalia gladiata TaxID=3824 RepID=A0AAN9MXT1_CANGL